MRTLPQSSAAVPSAVGVALRTLGANIALARRRRRLRQRDLAARAGVSLMTIVRVEKGHPTTAIGTYFAALWALGLDREIAGIAAPERDLEGVTLERARLPGRASRGGGLDDDF